MTLLHGYMCFFTVGVLTRKIKISTNYISDERPWAILNNRTAKYVYFQDLALPAKNQPDVGDVLVSQRADKLLTSAWISGTFLCYESKMEILFWLVSRFSMRGKAYRS